MLARAACRIFTVFYALLYFAIGVYGGGGGVKSEHAGSVRKHIASTLLSSVASGYPKPSMTAVRVSGGGRMPMVKVSKVSSSSGSGHSSR